MTATEIVKKCVADRLEHPVTEETIVFGSSTPELIVFSSLDSISLVSLLVDIEQAVYDEFKKEIIIASEKAMSRSRSPFRTVGSLAEFVEELLACES